MTRNVANANVLTANALLRPSSLGRYYNTDRPHSAPGYHTPDAFGQDAERQQDYRSLLPPERANSTCRSSLTLDELRGSQQPIAAGFSSHVRLPLRAGMSQSSSVSERPQPVSRSLAPDTRGSHAGLGNNRDQLVVRIVSAVTLLPAFFLLAKLPASWARSAC